MKTGGGIPAGKFTIFHGAKSSGKTLTALRLAGAYLKRNPNKSVVWADFEHAYEEDWVKNFIPDFGRFHLVDPDYGEQGVDLTCELAKADDVGLIVVDSLASIVATAEADSDAADSFVAVNVKLINRLCRRLAVTMSMARKGGNPVTTLFINQIRDKFGANSFAGTVRQPGGRMLEHLASLDIRFYQKEIKKVGGIPTQVLQVFTVDKNRVGLPRRSGEILSYLRPMEGKKAGEVEEVKTLIKFAKNAGLIEKTGNSWTVLKRRFSNATEIFDTLTSDHKFRTELKTETLKLCLSEINNTADEEGEQNDG